MPASMMMALVASRPNVTGSRMLIPASGPMPGSMPTKVPTTQPRKANHSTSGRNATEKPSIRLSMVASTGSEPDWHRRQRRFQQRVEQEVTAYGDADADDGGAPQRPAFDEIQQHEQQQRDAQHEADRGVERGRNSRHRNHRGGVG